MTEIVHYGKKGMKWGVRNDPKRSAQRAQKKVEKQTRHDDKMTMRKQTQQASKDKMSVYKMSNDEIQERIKRMQLEKQFLSLTDDRMSYHENAGKKYVKKIMGVGSQKAIEKSTQSTVNSVSKGLASTTVNTLAGITPGGQAALMAANLLKKAGR